MVYKLHEYIDECETYDSAIIALDGVFITAANEVFARYRLATTRQKPGQSTDENLQELRRLSKDCNFRAVSKTKHRDCFIRDAFINGILSHPIRQRLLEESTLTIDAAFQKARSLEIARRKKTLNRTFVQALARRRQQQSHKVKQSVQATKQFLYLWCIKSSRACSVVVRNRTFIKGVLHAQLHATGARKLVIMRRCVDVRRRKHRATHRLALLLLCVRFNKPRNVWVSQLWTFLCRESNCLH